MASTYLTRTPSGAGNRKTFTFSTWFKLGSVDTTKYFISSYSASSDSGYTHFSVQNNNKLHFAGNTTDFRTSTQLLRDPSAWYHVVLAVDTTQATASDRIKIYLNGSQITDFTNNNNPNQNDDFAFNQNAIDMVVGSANDGGSKGAYWDGAMSHIHFIDGTAYDASAFGETDATTGEWVGKTSPSVTYGTNGFFILKDGNGITDQSGEGNDFTLGGGTLTDLKDNPDNVFATANPLIANGNIDYSNGNTNSYHTYSGQWRWTASTLGASTGKYYSEYKISAIGSEVAIGIMDLGQSTGTTPSQNSANDFVGKFTNSISYVNSGTIYKANSDLQGSVTTYTTNDIIGVAMDLDNNTVQFYKNGSTVGTAVSITSGLTYNIGVAGYGNARILWNTGNGYFGTTAVSSAGTNASDNGIFEYDVPTGYTALSTKGLNL